ncbi:MAG: hypothetical protein JSR78_04610 [Proteobacteria bacterium]|nr:hypothetical protein [Pseudomonadota bacterium]
MREQRLQRNLKIVIAVLGLMIFAGLAAVAFKIISTAMRPAGSGVSSRTTTAGTDATVSFELPKGAKIVSMSLSGNRLAIQHDGPSGPGITILNAETGRRVLELKPTETLPRN